MKPHFCIAQRWGFLFLRGDFDGESPLLDGVTTSQAWFLELGNENKMVGLALAAMENSTPAMFFLVFIRIYILPMFDLDHSQNNF